MKLNACFVGFIFAIKIKFSQIIYFILILILCIAREYLILRRRMTTFTSIGFDPD